MPGKNTPKEFLELLLSVATFADVRTHPPGCETSRVRDSTLSGEPTETGTVLCCTPGPCRQPAAPRSGTAPCPGSSAQQHRAMPRSLRTRCVAVQPALEAALPSATAVCVDARRRGAISAVSSPHRARGLVWRLLPVLRRGASPGTWCRW